MFKSIPTTLVVTFSASFTVASANETSFLQPFEYQCQTPECTPCKEVNLRLLKQSEHHEQALEFELYEEQLKQLMIIRRALIQEASPNAQEKIDKQIFFVLRSFLTRRDILYRKPNAFLPDMDTIQKLKNEFGIYPLQVTEDLQYMLNLYYEDNDL